MDYFTADIHGNHSFMSRKEGFNSVKERNDWVINTWNSQVKPGDKVWVLGDFCFGKKEDIKHFRYRLKGKISLVLGNHDYKNKLNVMPELFTEIKDIKVFKKDHKEVFLCHYPMRVWAKSHYNCPSLYGHVHSTINPYGYGKQFDIYIGFWKRLLSWEEIWEIFDSLPNNLNYLKHDGEEQ
jgi:calcineurin-like phosphoesterase family protein